MAPAVLIANRLLAFCCRLMAPAVVPWALKTILPPVVPVPVEIVMDPLVPEVAFPVVMETAPVFPDVVLAPLVTVTAPEFEVAPDTSPDLNVKAVEFVDAPD